MRTPRHQPDNPEPMVAASGTPNTSRSFPEGHGPNLRRFCKLAVAGQERHIQPEAFDDIGRAADSFDAPAAASAVNVGPDRVGLRAEPAAARLCSVAEGARATRPVGRRRRRRNKCRTASRPAAGRVRFGTFASVMLVPTFNSERSIVVGICRRRHHGQQDPEDIESRVDDRSCDAAPQPDHRHYLRIRRRAARFYSVQLHPAQDRRRNTGKRTAAKYCDYCQDHCHEALLAWLGTGGVRTGYRSADIGTRPLLCLLLTDKRCRRLERRGAATAKGSIGRVKLVTLRTRLCHIFDLRPSGIPRTL